MKYDELQERIQKLGYRSTFPNFTQEEERELIELLKKRETYEEYQREQSRTNFFLNLMRK